MKITFMNPVFIELSIYELKRGYGDMKIAIASALDNNYTVPTVVMIYSLMQSASKDTVYHIFLLVPDDYKDENKSRFILLTRDFPLHQIHFINMGSLFVTQKLLIEHITFPTFYRLMLPQILNEWDKCIYLDGDMLIFSDLKVLHDIELSMYYVGGVKAPFYVRTNEIREENRKKIGIPDMDHYINAGVLLMNLKKLREDSMTKRFIELLDERKEQTNDQDIINVACYGKIKLLPFRFNYQLESACLGDEVLSSVLSYEERQMDNIMPDILHYSNSNVKPWNTLEYIYSDLWWEYFRKTSYRVEEKRRKAAIEKKRKENEERFERILEALRQERAVVLFGYSETSLELLNKLQRDFIEVVCFCDNDKKKWGKNIRGIFVESFNQCRLKYPNAFYINTSQNYAEEINRQLLDSGITNNKILNYRRNGFWLDHARKERVREIYF